MNPQLRVLYIEGFSPGPGLPSPLLTQAGAEWHVARMPYGMGDIIKNPYVLAIVGSVAACIWAVTILSGDIYVVLIIIFALAVCIVLLKRAGRAATPAPLGGCAAGPGGTRARGGGNSS